MRRSMATTGAIQVFRPLTVVNAFQTSFGDAGTMLSILKTRSPELFVTEVLRTSWLEATSDGQSAAKARKTGNEKLFVMLWTSLLGGLIMSNLKQFIRHPLVSSGKSNPATSGHFKSSQSEVRDS